LLTQGAAAAITAALGARFASPAQAQAPGEQTVSADHGRVIPPLPMPSMPLQCADGRQADLATLLQGRATAVHLMFTGCSSVCPIQGAIFQRVQSLLPDQSARGILLLSLSIDPFGDTPAAMRAWLKKFDARDGWIAAAPAPDDLDRLLALFGQGRSAVENHATQVNIVNRRGELIWRTPQLPPAESIAQFLQRV